MRILIQCPVQSKPEFEPIDRMVERARTAIARFAGERHFEYLCLMQQFETDLAEADAVCRPGAQRQICESYIWLAKGV